MLPRGIGIPRGTMTRIPILTYGVGATLVVAEMQETLLEQIRRVDEVGRSLIA